MRGEERLKAQLFTKLGVLLKFSSCSLRIKRLSVILNFEAPHQNIKAGESITLQLSSNDSLRFIVDKEISQHRFFARSEIMHKLDKTIEVSAKPDTPISNLAQSELKGVLSGAFKHDYILNNFGFSGTLWSLINTLADFLEIEPSLSMMGLDFFPHHNTLRVGKLLSNSRLRSNHKTYILENDFKLLPCRIKAKEVQELRYNFRESTVEVIT